MEWRHENGYTRRERYREIRLNFMHTDKQTERQTNTGTQTHTHTDTHTHRHTHTHTDTHIHSQTQRWPKLDPLPSLTWQIETHTRRSRFPVQVQQLFFGVPQSASSFVSWVSSSLFHDERPSWSRKRRMLAMLHRFSRLRRFWVFFLNSCQVVILFS